MRRSLISNPNKSPLLQRLLRKAPAANKETENRMKWTNVLYKAEGLRVKDNEDMLSSSLKEWGDQSENIVEKMQKRQEETEEHQ
ncbi:hypothetical protein CgunFtcFv8_008739 [Champsocephalus gunnari]|uniref:Ribosomal RNA-processing protein 14/surfeit locus protein 6 C-terminal domain-containing protein n=1 Tax=Champsocephalus gunnari TaxID=52237 RepID=A0AAN8D0N8_CHAGU|nr:hypothetical protein CgunFtcFv8_008739 [Champsocephalus gunnari]